MDLHTPIYEEIIPYLAKVNTPLAQMGSLPLFRISTSKFSLGSPSLTSTEFQYRNPLAENPGVISATDVDY